MTLREWKVHSFALSKDLPPKTLFYLSENRRSINPRTHSWNRQIMHAFVEEEKRDRAPPTKKHFDLCDITIRVLFSLHLTHVIERDEKIHTKFETAALSFFVSTFTALFEEFLPSHRLSIFYPGMILALKLDFV